MREFCVEELLFRIAAQDAVVKRNRPKACPDAATPLSRHVCGAEYARGVQEAEREELGTANLKEQR